MDANSRLRIVVLGYVVRGPLAGPTWHHLQHVLGLKDLGHDVWYLEDSTDEPFCYDPQRQVVDTDASYGLAFTQRVFGRAGVGDRWAYHDAHTGTWYGPAAQRMPEVCRTADVMINVSGINPLRPWLERIPCRVLVDTDPVFTQVDHLQDPERMRFARAHTAFFSFGESIGHSGCTVPDDGLPWQPTRQPLVLRCWQPAPPRPDGAFSTVMLWDSYDRRHWGGRTFGMKAEEMEHVLAMPQRCAGARFEVALGSPTAPHDRLRALGWRVLDPIALTSDPWVYQDYLRASKAEFSVAKHGYVSTASGWFSERSVSYMACGRPVVVQDTGFSRHLPVGDGLLAFRDPDEAVAAVAEVDARYAHHCDAARALVEAHFDARRVLARLLDRALGAQPPAESPGAEP
ncbi:glycosyltransferase [Calidifontimicrobium sp. SYSU G02091]|uniref:glycosyltransferase family protein n=1 Tax=Calidifontimicrobium sp. SYSU G02091 TaxID=2926421 RepID=UPI001F532250|nr:glycosyltransferase [Calidifontimicrobium sp. SYSU G02091]MCI1193669.1 glycosyltransferase [Calidifontimicrobium sp. SYSU G02091]